MRIREQALSDWTQQESKLVADESTGKQFHEYFVFWAETAEKLLEESRETLVYSDAGLRPIDAVRQALQIAENTIGNMHVQFLGQLLIYFISYWEWGEEVANDLTMIEMKLVHAFLQEDQMRKAAAARLQHEHESHSG